MTLIPRSRSPRPEALQEGGLHVELLELQALGLPVEPGGEGRRVAERQGLPGSAGGEVGELRGRLDRLPAARGIALDVRGELDRALLEANVVAEAEGPGDLPGQGGEVEMALEVRLAAAGGRDGTPGLDRPHRGCDVQPIGGPDAPGPIDLPGRSHRVELHRVARERLARRLEIEDPGVPGQREMALLVVDVEGAAEGPAGLGGGIGELPRPSVAPDRQIELERGAGRPLVVAHVSLELDRPFARVPRLALASFMFQAIG